MPAVAYLTWRFAHKVTPISRVVQQRQADLTEAADEAVVGIEMVQAFGREQDVRDRFGVRPRAVRDGMLQEARVEARYLPLLLFVPTLAIAAVLAIGGHLVINGELTLGQFALFNTLLLQLAWPLEALGWIVNLGQRAIASAGPQLRVARRDRLAARAGTARDAAGWDRCRCGSRESTSPTRPSTTCCESVDLELAPGEIVAVCGGTGAGKSSLLGPRRALLRPAARPRRDRRRRRARPGARRSARRRRGRHAAAGAVLGAAARQPPRRPLRRTVGGRARGLRGRRRRRVPRPASGRLRHAHRRARREPLGRPAPARRARARPDLGRARARARRPALGRRHAHRGERARAPARGRRGPDGAGRRATALDRRGRRPRGRARRRRASPRKARPRASRGKGGAFDALFGDEAVLV